MAKKPMTENDMEQVTKSTAEELKAQDKVKVRLPLDPQRRKQLESDLENGKKVEWPFQVVSINGHIYQIQLGKEVEVPKSVAEVLEQAGLI